MCRLEKKARASTKNVKFGEPDDRRVRGGGRGGVREREE